MEFVGKDFLKMQPPKGYKPGIGRGALGFSVRGNLGFDTSVAIDDGAAAIYAQVDRRKRAKRKAEPHVQGQFDDAPAVDEAEWLSIPEATDTTFRNKRLRKQQQMAQRTYNLPDSLINIETTGPNFSRQTKIDPQNPNGWVGYAKQLQSEQNFKKARSTILKGCSKCPAALEVWLVAIDLHPLLDDKRNLAARAVEALPHELQIWRKAVEIEDADTNKLKVVHKALEHNPESESFWIQAVTLEPDKKTKLMVLEQAVALVPASEQLWILYYGESNRLEVLDKALDVLPHSIPLWSQKLYASRGSRKEYLQELVNQLPPGDWAAEINKHPHPDDLGIAELLLNKFSDILPDNLEQSAAKDLAFKIWTRREPQAYREWAQRGNQEALEKVLEQNGDLESYELMVKHDSSTEALERAYSAFPLEFLDRFVEKLDPERAAKVLATAESKTGPQWLKYASFLPETQAVEALNEAIKAFPDYGELYLTLDRIQPNEQVIDTGLAQAPHCADLWLRKTQNTRQTTKKRAILAQAMAANPRNEKLWVERILVERSAGKSTENLVETAVHECRQSGRLWYLYLESLDDLKRKTNFSKALEETNSAPEVLYSLAKFYKARGKEYKPLLERVGDAQSWCEGLDLKG